MGWIFLFGAGRPNNGRRFTNPVGSVTIGLAFAIFLMSMLGCGEKDVVRSYYPSGSVKTEAVTKDAVLNGRAVMTGEAGNKLSEAHYRSGLLHGKSVEYYPDGKIKAQAEYQDGALHGTSFSFHKNGVKASEATFHGGALVGKVKNWDENGAEKL
jgi:antitoxin component YwqK of YwqJK toxin-antitoxin module